MALLLNAGDTVSRSYSYTQPSPLHPSQPQGTGEKTGNLFDINATPTKYSQSTTVTVDGRTLTISGAWYIYYEIDVAPNTDYYVDWTIDYAEIQGRGTIAILTTSGQTIKQQDLRPFSFNSGENQRIRLYIYSGNNEPKTIILSNIMLNLGSTPLPYEPYGYKIPILSASTTTPVYLGEVESTRRIKKYVFTGEENGTIYSTGTSRKGIEITGITGIIGGNADIAILAICTHYQPNTRNALYRNTDNGISNAYQNDRIIFYDASCQTVESFQQFCAQQRAAGTPVTVWYVLATEQTGIVNEPLMKIGEYADTVSGITIPTIAGANAVDVLTTLEPSEVDLTYHGWHDASVKEWDGSEWEGE